VKKATAVQSARKYRSRLREFIWAQLKLLFVRYDENQDGLLQAKEI